MLIKQQKRLSVVLFLGMLFLLFSCTGDLAGTIGGDIETKYGNIIVLIGTVAFESGAGSYEVGEASLDSSIPITVKIENNGEAALNLSSDAAVVLSGVGLGAFSIDSLPDQVIAIGSTAEFVVRFEPTSSGDFLVTVSIFSDDPEIPEFNFDISGTGYREREISLSVDSAVIEHGTGEYIFGDTIFMDGDGGDTSGTITFTISNLGDRDLSSIAISPVAGVDASDFELNTSGVAETLGPAGDGADTTSFEMVFDPLDIGQRTATLSISSDDTDSSPYTVTLTGMGDWWGIASIDITGNVGTFTSMALDGDDIYIVYSDESDGNDPFTMSSEDLMVIVSNDLGATWNTPVVVESDAGSVSFYDPDIAADGGNAYISYAKYTSGSDDVLGLASSSDGFINFDIQEPDIYTTHDPGYHSSIEVIGNAVYIAHHNDPLSFSPYLDFTRSEDGGTTWDYTDAGYYVDYDDTYSLGMNSDIAVSQDTIFISYWLNSSSDEVRIAVIQNGGDDFETVEAGIVSISPPATPVFDFNFAVTDIEVVGSTVYLLYSDGLGDSSTARMRFAQADYDFDTHTWGTWSYSDVEDVYSFYFASMAVADGVVYVAYYVDVDAAGTTWNLYLNKSTNGGLTWMSSGILVDSAGGDVGSFNSMVANGTNVYISYYDWNNGDLKFAKSIDGGETW